MRLRRQVFSLPRIRNWGATLERPAIIAAGKHRQKKFASVSNYLVTEGWTWETAPTGVLLDKHFNTDLPVNLSGNIYSIDVTIADLDWKVKGKVDEMRYLQRAGYSPLSIDRAAVWVINPESMPSNEEIMTTLRKMANQKPFTEVYYL